MRSSSRKRVNRPKRSKQSKRSNRKKRSSNSPKRDKAILNARYFGSTVILPRNRPGTNPQTFTFPSLNLVVDVYAKHLEVYKRNIRILSTPFKKIFDGSTVTTVSKPGKALLVQLQSKKCCKYLYIGSEIYEFESQDGYQLQLFNSTGRSWALGKKFMYDLKDKTFFERDSNKETGVWNMNVKLIH